MERKTTKFKYLLLIPALFLGMSLFAQKAEPVKLVDGKNTVEAVSNHRLAGQQLEQQIQEMLSGDVRDASSNTLKRKPLDSKVVREYEAKKASTALAELQKKSQAGKTVPIKEVKELLRSDATEIPDGLISPNAINAPVITPGGKYPTDIVYAHNHWATGSIAAGPVSFALNNPGTLTQIASYGSPWIYGSSWANGVWYGTEAIGSTPNNSKFLTIDPATGNRTYINNSQFATAGDFIAEIAYDWTTNTMYGVAYNFTSTIGSLYTIDLITGVPTYIGSFGSAAVYYLGCDQNGVLYGADVVGNNLLTFDKTTGAATVVGPVGFDISFVGGMEFDNSDNTMYCTAFDYTPYYGLLYTINLSTGNFTAVGAFPTTYMSGFVIQNMPFITYPDDLGITAITAPVTSQLLNNAEHIQVSLKNFGSSPQSNFPVSYTINGGTPVMEIVPGPLAAGTVMTYTFTQTADLSAYATYNITVCTALANDQNTMNDCKTKQVMKIMPTWTDTIWPQNLPFWTGTTNGTTFSENSRIKMYAGNVSSGWAKFDITSIPDQTQISNIKLGFYTYDNYLGYFYVTQMTNDPMAGTPASVMSDLQTETQYLQITNGNTNGWHNYNLPALANTDLANSTLQNWFALGFYEYESSTWYTFVEGWAETHRPYLVVTYGYIPGPNDCGITGITTPVTGAGLSATTPVTVDLRNYGSNVQTSVPVQVVINGPGGVQTLNATYTGSLAGNTVTSFVVGNADMHLFGAYTIQACTQLTGDNFANNDCFSKNIANNCPLKVVTATSPSTGMSLTAAEPFNISLSNIGTVALSNVSIQYTINGGAPVSVNFPGPLAPGATTPFSLGTVDLHLYGTYNFQVCPNFPGNIVPNSGCYNFAVTNNIPTVTDTFWPQNVPYWTGTTNGTIFTQNSKIFVKANSAGTGVSTGWAKFDIAGLPDNSEINSVTLRYYQEINAAAYYRINRLSMDPMANSASAVYSGITSGFTYVVNYNMSDNLWLQYDLGTTGKTDLSAARVNNWFAVGFFEYETSDSYESTMYGWAETGFSPYIIVNYSQPIAHDVSIESINIDPFVAVGNVYPKATIKNLGASAETFTVTMDGPGGYLSTKTITNLVPGATVEQTFDVWNAPLGPATLHACVNLATDLNFSNNCKSKSFTVESKLTKAYGFIAADPSGTLPLGPIVFFLEHPNVLTSLAPSVAADFISAGCWANGTWYVAEYSDPANNSNLWTVNPNTGAMTLVGSMGFNCAGLTYDHTTNTMWALATYQDDLGAWRTDIYTVNPATAATTLVRACGPIGLAINLACSQQGMLLFAEMTNDRLWAYDPLIDELELMGPLGINLNYAQDAEFDKETNILYFAGCTASGGSLYTVNLATGAITSQGNFQGNAEVCGFAIPYSWNPITVDMGAMWITHPTIGNLTAEEPILMRVRNYGLTTCTDMNLTVTVGTTTFSDNWAVWGYPPIDPGVYFDYAFIPVFDFSAPGLHCVKSWVSDVVPAGDVNQVNDTVAKCVNNISCGTIDCFANAIPEGEPCGNNENGGCYSTPNAYVDLTNDATYCGTLWKVDTLRDTDWYKFTIGSPKGITIKARAEFDLDVILVKLPCSNMEVVATKTITKCSTDSLVIDAFGAGQYAIVFAPNWIDFNTACNNNTRYTFKWSLRPAKYCTANTSMCDEYISNLQVNTTPAFSNMSGCSPGGYKDYTNLNINVDAGSTYQVTVSNGDPYSSDQCGVWIDWNRDYDFYDPNEKLAIDGSPGNGPYPTSFTVPADATPGPTRLRARITWTGLVDPCGTTSYGEVEDYTLNIHAVIPPIITTIGSLTETCPGTKTIPITVEEFNGVNGFNLILQLDNGVTYAGITNVNPELTSGILTPYVIGNNIQLNWISESIAANIGTGTLLSLVLNTTSGDHSLIWDTEECQYSSFVTGIFDDVYNDGLLSFGNCSNLSGMIKYKNNLNSVIRDSVAVKLYTGGTTFFQQTNVDATGHYEFVNLPNNTYTMRAFSGPASQTPFQKTWVGGTATDALLILRHYVGMQLLTGLNLTVGDVNVSGGTPNAVDALAVSRRFVQAIQNFGPTAPDWYFQTFTITIDGTANQVQEIRGLCAGDVNGSGIPLNSVPSKITPSVFLTNEGTVYLDNEIVDVPVMVQNGMTVGAVSLVLNYPNNLDIVGVKVANSPENLSYTAQNGQLRMAWFTTEPIDLKAGEVMVTLQVKANSISNKDLNFFSTEESAIANELAQDYESASLMMPKLVTLNGSDNYTLSNFPNPFNTTTDIHYSIAKGGFVTVKVYNVLGEEVATVVNADQKAGNYTVTFDGSKLPKGVYVYKLQVNDITKANSMVITQ